MDKQTTAYKLLAYLSDGDFHSGEQLAQSLKLTRTAVWKGVQQLQALGVDVQAVTGRGYRIPDGIELLNQALIEKNLCATTRELLDQLIILENVSSTNDYLLHVLKEKPRQTMACLAEYQTKGRGRHGRHWISSFASGCCLSLLWHFECGPNEIMGLSLAMGVAIVNALKRYGISEGIALKWPNDILWQGRKLAGILIEMIAESYGLCSVVVGIGLNLQMPAQPHQELSQPWVNLADIVEQPPQRNYFIALLLNELVQTLRVFSSKDLDEFIAEWQQYDSLLGQEVVLNTASGEVLGVMQGISSRGELLLETHDGKLSSFAHGEVSIKKS